MQFWEKAQTGKHKLGFVYHGIYKVCWFHLAKRLSIPRGFEGVTMETP